MVMPGATSMDGWITFCDGGACTRGAGGGATGAPAYPPISVGLGNDSLLVPLRAPSMVDFQMSDGRPEPYTGPPHLFTSGWSPCTVPTHTAVDSDGVYPTIQASLLASVSPSCVVPVLAADGRPPARLWPRE